MDELTNHTQVPPIPSTLSIKDAAHELDVLEGDVLRFIQAGDLPHIRVQGQHSVEYRLLPEDVQAMRAQLHPHLLFGSEQASAVSITTNGHARSPEVPAVMQQLIATLGAANERLLRENARLQETVRSQAESLGQIQAERDVLALQLTQVKTELHGMSDRVDAMAEEVGQLRIETDREAMRGYLTAWKNIQRRPWWLRVSDRS